MTRATYAVLSVVLVFSVGAPLRAHHSFAAHYDMQKRLPCRDRSPGPATNPHSWFYLDVKEADGTMTPVVLRGRHAERHDPQRIQGERARRPEQR